MNPAPDRSLVEAGGPASKRSRAWIAAAALLVALPIATARVVAAPAPPAGTATTGEFRGRAGGTAFQLAATRSGEDWYNTARNHYRRERYAEAGAAYVRAAAGQYRIGTALYNAACSYSLAGRNDEAIVALEQALAAGFDQPESIASDDDLDALRSDPRFQKLAGRAKGTDRVQQRRIAAIATYDRLRASRSTDTDAWHDVGIDLMRLDESERAIDAFARQNAIKPSANAIYNVACARALSGDRLGAFEALERAIVSGSGDPDHMKKDSDLRSLRGDARFDELVRLAADLELFSPLTLLSVIGGPAGWRASLDRFERVAREHPSLGRAWFNLGYARLEADDLKGSVEASAKALELKYRPPTTMYNLACAYAQMRKTDEAIQWLERAESAGMKVGETAYRDDDLKPLRLDPRFRRMLDRWSDERRERWKGDS